MLRFGRRDVSAAGVPRGPGHTIVLVIDDSLSDFLSPAKATLRAMELLSKPWLVFRPVNGPAATPISERGAARLETTRDVFGDPPGSCRLMCGECPKDRFGRQTRQAKSRLSCKLAAKRP